jgi:hypothetical protein
MQSKEPMENSTPDLGFSLLERIKRYVEEQYYQLRLLPELSLKDRQKIFSSYSSRQLLKILTYLRKQENSAQFLYSKALDSVSQKVIHLLKNIEKEREEQISLGIFPESHSPYQSHIRKWKMDLVHEVRKMNLSPSEEQRLSLVLLNSEEPLPAPESTELAESGLRAETLVDPVLSDLFHEIFKSGSMEREPILRFLNQDRDRVMAFLDSRLRTGKNEELSRVSSVLAFLPGKQSILLLEQLGCEGQADQRLKAEKTLKAWKKRKGFQKHLALLDRCLARIRRKSELAHLELERQKKDRNRKSLYLDYFSRLSDPSEESRIRILKQFSKDDYLENQNFLERIFRRDESSSIRCHLLKNIAGYRLQDLYPLFEEAFRSRSERVIYHAILYVKEYSLVDLVPGLKRDKQLFKVFNRQFAEQVLSLLD